ncbi:hypothetical protein [Solibacillus sp. FSL K6-1523]|uniref:hypothetical protein n=1 Tax=Solibacillus sp. FSL K6-1523 TaxID=2921471 RepID=UPI0030FCA1C9
MKISNIISILLMCIFLVGCSTSNSQEKEPVIDEESAQITYEPIVKKDQVATDVTNQKKQEGHIEVIHGKMIDQQVVSPIGQSETPFNVYGDMAVKVYILNTGTESFIYRIQNVDDDKRLDYGILKGKESFERVFYDLPEGSYIISYLVEEEGFPMDIAFTEQVYIVE